MEMDFTPKGQIQVCTNVGHAIDAMALLSLGWPKIQILIIMSVDQQSFTTYRYFVNIHSCNFMTRALLFYEVNDPLLKVCNKP